MPAAATTTMPVVPGVLDGAGQRVDLPRLRRLGAVGQVDHPDVHAVVVAVLDDPVEGGDDLGDVGAAVAGADLHVEQLGVRRDAGEHRSVGLLGVVVVVLAGDDAGHVGAVAVSVEVAGPAGWLSKDRSGPSMTLSSLVQPGNRRDAGVDHGDGDSLPAKPRAHAGCAPTDFVRVYSEPRSAAASQPPRPLAAFFPCLLSSSPHSVESIVLPRKAESELSWSWAMAAPLEAPAPGKDGCGDRDSRGQLQRSAPP